MIASRNFLFVLLALMAAMCARAAVEPRATSAWAHLGGDGKLAYQTLPAGNRIMDFSSAGYMGGGVPLPDVPEKKRVRPSGGDDTAAIQAALDEVGALPLVNGSRGAVVLERGEFQCEATLNLRTSGVVLRGSGAGDGGTRITMLGKTHVAFALGAGGRDAAARPVGAPIPVADAYVPAGTRTLAVRDGSTFKPGDTVLVQHPVTAEWVKFMGMDTLVRDGKKETWLAVGRSIDSERTITAIASNTITIDVPLTDALDAKYLSPPGATVVKCTPPARLAQIGIEDLRVFAPPQAVTINDPHHTAVRVGAVEDAWLRDVAIVDTVNSITLGGSSRRITLERVAITHTVATKGAAKPADFSVNGSQIFLHACTDQGDSVFYLATGAGVTGPIVLLDCEFRGGGWIQPHQRWATGLLVDNCRVPDGGIDFMNRGEMGSGHGWAIGWAVAWNCTAKEFLVQRPPGAANWAIGCTGEQRTDVMPFKHATVLPAGMVESPGAPVTPASLYLAQLTERRGAAAVKAAGL
jgi:hypothetical protein